jgi:DNA-binding Lrp family transcriptional regulator
MGMLKQNLLSKGRMIVLILGSLMLICQPAFSADGSSKFDSREMLSQTLGEGDWVDPFVDGLTAEQVHYLNKDLNNAVKSGLVIDFDSDENRDLLDGIDENWDKHDFKALTTALEQEARFLEKYEKTGDEKFLTKAETEKEKFLAKVGKKSEPVSAGGELAKKEAKNAAKDARKAAKAAAREAKKVAREAAKEATKEAAKAAKKG